MTSTNPTINSEEELIAYCKKQHKTLFAVKGTRKRDRNGGTGKRDRSK